MSRVLAQCVVLSGAVKADSVCSTIEVHNSLQSRRQLLILTLLGAFREDSL